MVFQPMDLHTVVTVSGVTTCNVEGLKAQVDHTSRWSHVCGQAQLLVDVEGEERAMLGDKVSLKNNEGRGESGGVSGTLGVRGKERRNKDRVRTCKAGLSST